MRYWFKSSRSHHYGSVTLTGKGIVLKTTSRRLFAVHVRVVSLPPLSESSESANTAVCKTVLERGNWGGTSDSDHFNKSMLVGGEVGNAPDC